MLDELTHMDRITQLQDAIDSLLTIMSRSIDYLHNHTDFRQVSDHIPISKARNPEKVHKGEVLESNRTELVTDLVRKAKQIQYLIDALPVPEPEEQQATRLAQMENELQQANAEYDVATKRARAFLFLSFETVLTWLLGFLLTLSVKSTALSLADCTWSFRAAFRLHSQPAT
ncbi:hypothetical protein BKA62DRAFT_616539 [Auriculariales sp. MPI-PUGE-AT-0066]|nr:hypothetical protein BKA62DRAFT_616539 [Auriculariales sp. MPI-PUGE-AT-0066]